jgi:hypothetical protein
VAAAGATGPEEFADDLPGRLEAAARTGEPVDLSEPDEEFDPFADSPTVWGPDRTVPPTSCWAGARCS